MRLVLNQSAYTWDVVSWLHPLEGSCMQMQYRIAILDSVWVIQVTIGVGSIVLCIMSVAYEPCESPAKALRKHSSHNLLIFVMFYSKYH